jgi:thiol-disulfide isomerase/thioredoxin
VSTGAWVALAAVVLALGLGLYRAATDGRFRGTHRVRGVETAETPEPPAAANVLAGTPWESGLGERATLLQFSSAFCAPCRATRWVLAEVAATTPGVTHIDVDAEHHLDVVRRLGVLRTPTTLILDDRGRDLGRASGVPSRDQVLSVLNGPPGWPPAST